jgi:hypothetical protein
MQIVCCLEDERGSPAHLGEVHALPNPNPDSAIGVRPHPAFSFIQILYKLIDRSIRADTSEDCSRFVSVSESGSDFAENI